MLRIALAVVLLVLALYGAREGWALVAGPHIVINSPKDYFAVNGGIVTIEGVVQRTASLLFNGTPLLHEEDGSFSSTLTFPRGGSILTFVAADRFGRKVTVTRNIFVP
jgi:hypothetical protein